MLAGLMSRWKTPPQVSLGQGIGHSQEDPAGDIFHHRSFSIYILFQADPFDELHHEILASRLHISIEIDDRHQIRMRIQLHQRAHFLLEKSIEARTLGEFRMQYLQGTALGSLDGQEDLAQPSSRQKSFELPATQDCTLLQMHPETEVFGPTGV